MTGKQVSNFTDRFRTLVDELDMEGIKQEDIARRLGSSKQTVSAWYTGARSPKPPAILAISQTFKIRIEWLHGFDVEKYDNGTSLSIASFEESLSKQEKDLLTGYRALVTEYQKLIDAFIKAALAQNESMAISDIVDMIVYDFPAAAGIPIFAEDGYTRMKFKVSEVPKGADFGIRIAGDSMEPTIQNGSIVFVRKTSALRNNDIGIFMVDVEESVCKRYIKNGKTVELHSDNPSHLPIILKPHQQLGIVGKVLGYK